jgi:hypothetical protein
MQEATPVSLGGQLSGVIDTIESCLNASVLEWNLRGDEKSRMQTQAGGALVLSLPKANGNDKAVGNVSEVGGGVGRKKGV